MGVKEICVWKCGRVQKWEPELRGGANCDVDGGGKFEEGRGNESKTVTFLLFKKINNLVQI